jgi:hypothetical protein
MNLTRYASERLVVFVGRSFGFRALGHRVLLTASRTLGLLRAQGNLKGTRTRCASEPLPEPRPGWSVASIMVQ